MKKRVISPLIATVILVGFVIMAAIIFVSFGRNVIDEEIEEQEENVDVLSLNIDIDLLGYSTDCEGNPPWLSILVDNKGEENVVGFIAKINFDNGFQIIQTDSVLRSNHQNRIYFIDLSCSKEIDWIEVTPIIAHEGEEVTAYWASSEIRSEVEIEDPVGLEKSCVYGGEEGSENVYLLGPYENSVVAGYLIEDAPYSFYVDGDLVQSGESEQLFLAHFDESMESTTGDVPTDYSIEYLDGKFGGGLGGWVEYDSPCGFDLEEGTVEMWLIQRAPDTGDHNFFEYSDSHNQMELKFKPGIEGFQFKYFDYGGVPDVENDSFNLRAYELELNKPYHVALSWSAERNFSYFYINGQKEISAAYDITSMGNDGKIKLGHSTVSIIDEARIYSRLLKAEEIKYIYMRNKPLQDNEIYYSGKISSGDEIKLESGGESISGYAALEKVKNIDPAFHVVANTDTLEVSFETPSPMESCRYDYYPKEFIDLDYSIDQISDTSYGFDIPVESTLESINFYIKCEDICKDDYSFYQRVRVLPEIDKNQPNLLNQFWGGSIKEEHIADLSKYDVLSISPGNLQNLGRLKRIRELNPNILIYVYDTLWDVSGKETESSYYMWDKHYMMEEEWRLTDNEGNYVMNIYFPYSENYNMNINAGTGVHEAMAQYAVDAYMSRGYFDGMFYDNIKHSFWWLFDRESPDCDWGEGPNCFPQPLDMNLDDINEDLDNEDDFDMDEEIFKVGLREVMRRVGEKLGPDTLVMLNNAVEFQDISNGKEWEEKLRESTFIYHTDPNEPDGFPYWQEYAREPKINMNMVNIGHWENYEHARYGLCTSLMYDMYTYFVIDDDRRNTFWMDEYAVDLQTGIPERTLEATGYLGEPLGAVEQVDNNPQVLMRKFENGIAVVSNSVSYYNVDLGKYYRLIDGVQDPGKNTGELVDHVLLARTDGRVLLLPLCSNNPNDDDDCI